jgi:hypothetical protein
MRRVTFVLGFLVVAFMCISLTIRQVEGGQAKRNEEDDDFAEFDDDFDEDPSFRRKPNIKDATAGKEKEKDKDKISKQKDPDIEFGSDDEKEDASPKTSKSNDDEFQDKVNAEDDEEEGVVEDDDFEGVDDDDEFDEDGEGRKRDRDTSGPPKLTITSVPMPARGWQAYYAELLMLSGIAVYLLNYVLGRYKNQKIAQVFFDYNWNILESNFCLLGDSTKVEDDQGTRNFLRMSDSLFQMWCSGRVCCEGMLLELKLLKRQDLVAVISNIFRPARDSFRFTVEMSKEDMDSVVFAVANKKQAAKISKEYNDLINYCPDRRGGEKYGLPPQFVVMSELPETGSAVLDSRATSVIAKYANQIESIHYSDQFTGTKSTEPETTKDGIVKPPEPKRLLIFTFLLPTNTSGNNIEQAVEEIQPLFQFVFHTIDRFKRIRLSKEGKLRADKNRAKVEEAYMKQTHAARAEAAAARKEEKRRQEKERILQEEDPEKQRRWEEKEQKREKKKKTPKMKQLKIKSS